MNVIELFKSRLLKQDNNPIEAAKRMVSAVQVFVGIRDVFGDKELSKHFITRYFSIKILDI